MPSTVCGGTDTAGTTRTTARRCEKRGQTQLGNHIRHCQWLWGMTWAV